MDISNNFCITVKVLKGEECQIEVNENSTILEVKQKIEKKIKHPIPHQKLLLMGRPLNCDNKSVGSYGIKENSKLTLILKQPDTLKDAIYKGFRKYFNEKQSEKLTNDFMDDFNQRMKYLSMDDIERIAGSLNMGLSQNRNQNLLDDYFLLEGPSADGN